MENKPNNDSATPDQDPANKPATELSLADQILAMKAERDARQKATAEGASADKTPAETASGQAAGTPAESVPGQAAGAPPTASPQPETGSMTRPEPGLPEAGGPAQSDPAAGHSEARPAEAGEPVAQTPAQDPAESLVQHQEPQPLADAPIAEPEEAESASTPAASQGITEVETGTGLTAPEAPAATGTQAPGATEEEKNGTPGQPGTLEEHPDEHEEEHEEIDYTSFDKSQLAKEIKRLASDTEAAAQGKKVTELYRLYQQRVKDERIEALERFVATGGEEAGFVYQQTEDDAAVEQTVVQFREHKSRQAKLQEEVKAKNLQAKNELLERLRQLVESGEESQSSLDEMKQLQASWKAIGAVPQGESQELWNVYHALLDKYYNNRSIFNELKDLDRKKNLEAKTALCERAESLEQYESINKALLELKHLHEEWKNTGPVPADMREPIWNRFIEASEKVHQRRKEFLTQRKEQEETNLLSKQNLLNMVEEFQTFMTDRINEWRGKTDELQKLKEVWEKVGLVPKEKAEEINKRFWGAYKTFFHNKNAFFKALDEQKLENLRLKIEMCEYAESLRDSDDYAGTKEKLIQLQKKWKTIGRVPDKYSDEVWNRFRAACNAFFDKKTAEVAAQEAAREEKAAAKRNFVNDLEQRIQTLESASQEGLEELLSQWRELGTDDTKPNQSVEQKFYSLAEQYISRIPNLSEEERKDMLFQMEVANLKAHPDNSQQLYQKEQSLRKEIQALEHAITTLKTNMDFFARSKNADQIRQDYSEKINESQRKIDELKRRLKLMHRK